MALDETLQWAHIRERMTQGTTVPSDSISATTYVMWRE
jgi:hypothetical protein